jgi:RPA family protein
MAGCEQKTVNQIKADPSRYANREVAIVGTVTRSYSVLGKGVYEVEDGTGKLWVASNGGVPREGARILVRGTIRDAFNLGAFVKLPEQISSGLVMIENSHRAK